MASFTRNSIRGSSPAGVTLQMVQLWVNLRAEDKRAPAGYQTLLKGQIPKVALPQDAGTVRVIAGQYDGKRGPAKTFTPIHLWDVQLRAGTKAELPLPDGHTSTFLVIEGEVSVNAGKAAVEGDLAIFDRVGHGIEVAARTEARLLIMACEPIDEPVVGHGPLSKPTTAVAGNLVTFGCFCLGNE